MKHIGILLVVFLLMMSVGLAGAATVTFDDYTDETAPIIDGYNGFNWTSGTTDIGSTDAYTVLDPDGFVAYNWGGGAHQQ